MKDELTCGKNEKTVNILLEDLIKAPVEKVFPLCCPVEEYKWVTGWKCNIIHCPNDRVEMGTVFAEILTAPFLQGGFLSKTTWTAIYHDETNYILHFRLDNKISSSLYKIEMSDDRNSGTSVILDFTYNATNSKGCKLIKKNVENKIRIMLTIISKMLKHYCEQNRIMTLLELQKVVLAEKGLSVTDKLHIAINWIFRIK